MPTASVLGRRCVSCGNNYTTVNKKFVHMKSKGERWYRYDDGDATGYRCHNCYMKWWSKKNKEKKR